jgi:hypothetical protein
VKRRGIGVGAVAAAFLLAATAAAATHGFAGRVDTGGTVAFDAKLRGHRVVSVRNFLFSGVGAVCNEGPGTADISNDPLPQMNVNARHRFRGAFKIAGTDQRARVRGLFKHHWRRARGRLRLTGSFDGATNCDTGVRLWRARRG